MSFRSLITRYVSISGLPYVALRTEPSAKHLVRLGSQIGIKSFQEFYLHLGMTTRQWENTVNRYYHDYGHSSEGIMCMALIQWKRLKLSNLAEPTMKDIEDALVATNLDTHLLCQV